MNTCYNPFSLAGKTILVTGASSGIGKATAIECSKLGAKLIITGRNEERLKETLELLEGVGHEKVVADLSSTEGINSLVASVNSLDGVVLCAGIGMTIPVQFANREKFEKVFGVNMFSTSELMSSLYKKKKVNKESSFVLIDSIGGVTRFSPGNSIYGASKAALSSFSKFASKEFAQRQIRVNCICPGMVETPLIHGGAISDEDLNEDKKKYLANRYGNPEEIAYAAVYLLSDASKWVTGINLVIDGGVSV